MEEWKILQEDEKYSVSNFGNVRNNKTGRVLKVARSGCGYLTVGLSHENKMKTYKVHRLVAKYFIDNPTNDLFVDHIDGNKHNNLFTNLRWCNHNENMANRRTKKGIDQGICIRKNGFESVISHNKKFMYLGLFDTIEEAREAYANAKRQLCKEFSPV